MRSAEPPVRPRRREPLRATSAPVLDLTEVVDLDEEQRPRILIVEDERDIRDWLRVALQQEGWRVNCAPSVRTGLEMTNRLQPDVVLLDQRLPDGKGLDLAHVIRDTLPDVELLMFSAYLDLDAEAEAEALGVETISKVDGKALFSVLRGHYRTLVGTPT